MKREDCYVKQEVFFGKTGNGVTRGVITKLNPTKVKVTSLESRGKYPAGSPWEVPYNLLTPADPKAVPPKGAKRAPPPKPGSKQALAAMQPVIGKVELAYDATRDRENERDGKTRLDRYFVGTIELNSHVLPLEVHLIKDPTFYSDKDWHISGEIGVDLGIVHSPGSLQYKSQQCQECSGNWGVSEPETSGLTAIATFKAVRPIIEAAGYKVGPDLLHKRWGWSLDVNCPVTGPTRDVTARRYYSAWVTPIDCPVHGKHEQRQSEFNA